EAVPGVGLDTLPDVEHGAARRVHEDAADGAQPLEVRQRDAEGGDDDDVVGRDPGEVEFSVGARIDEPDPHALQPLVDVRVVDDLADEEDAPVRELVGRLVGVLDGAVHAVAEPELGGQPDGDAAESGAVPAVADLLDKGAVVLGVEQRAHGLLEPEAAPEVRLFHGLTSLATSLPGTGMDAGLHNRTGSGRADQGGSRRARWRNGGTPAGGWPCS